jgi:hypothetical protein
VEIYPGVFEPEVLAAFVDGLHPAHVFRTSHCWKTPAEIDTLVKDDVTDDPVFGRMSRLTIEGILERRKMRCRKRRMTCADGAGVGFTLTYRRIGCGYWTLRPREPEAKPN